MTDRKPRIYPWLPPVTAEEIQQLREQLDQAVCQLAINERWTNEQLDAVLVHVARQPDSTLLSEWRHFSDRLAETGRQSREKRCRKRKRG